MSLHSTSSEEALRGDKFAMAASADEDGEGRVRSSMSGGALNSQSVI